MPYSSKEKSFFNLVQLQREIQKLFLKKTAFQFDLVEEKRFKIISKARHHDTWNKLHPSNIKFIWHLDWSQIEEKDQRNFICRKTSKDYTLFKA